MPLFIDRHNLSEFVTAEIVAQLHLKDLEIQDQFDCKGLTYWFDDKRKTAFCLIEAPNVEAIHKMHNYAHGQVPNSVIEVDATTVESFLGRIEDPRKSDHNELTIITEPAFRIIMVISLVKPPSDLRFSESQITIAKTLSKKIVQLLNRFSGSMVTQSDTHYLISFTSATNALKAAKAVLKIFENSSDKKIQVKIGLNAGMPVSGKEKMFEETILLAERMCEFMKGRIVISSKLAGLYESETSEDLNQSRQISFLSVTDEKFITLLMDQIESAWNDSNFRIDDFLKPLHCSKSQFYRNVIRITGKSPNRFIKEYRLKKAIGLLQNGEGNISEVAFAAGFSSPSYFTKCFLEQFHQLPSALLA